MRALSETQARKCENAKGKRCSCRCQKACHGRGSISRDAPREVFESLPPSDPHYLEPKTMKENRIPERYRNFSPAHARKTLRHARKYLAENAREWALHPGDISVAADCGVLLQVLESKVALGVDKIVA
jgi:hypothetical protein